MEGYCDAIQHFLADGLERHPDRLRSLLLDAAPSGSRTTRVDIAAIVAALEFGVASTPTDQWGDVLRSLESDANTDPGAARMAMAVWAEALDGQFDPEGSGNTRRARRLRGGIGAVVIVAVVAAVAIAVLRSGDPYTRMSSLSTGDCVSALGTRDDLGGGRNIVVANVVDCSDTHQYEYLGFVPSASVTPETSELLCRSAVRNASPVGFVPDRRDYGCFSSVAGGAKGLNSHFTAAGDLHVGSCIAARPFVEGAQVVTMDCSSSPHLELVSVDDGPDALDSCRANEAGDNGFWFASSYYCLRLVV